MEFTTLTVEELKTKFDRGDRLTLLDIRSASVFWQGHIRGAVNLPYERISDFADERLDQTKPLVVYGEDDRDVFPLRAAEELSGRNFYDIALLDGGFYKWRAAGYITEAGE